MSTTDVDTAAIEIHGRLSAAGHVGRRWRLSDLLKHATHTEIAALVEYGAAKYLPGLDMRSPVRLIVFF